MPAPTMRIPVALDLKSFQQQTQAASDRVGETLKVIGRQFAKLNGEVLGVAGSTAGGVSLAWSQSLTRQALGFASLAAGALAAFKIISGAIDLTREKLEEMVAVADKSRETLVSPRFFQAFNAEARKLQVSAGDLEGALKKAFEATKEKSPIDLSKWEVGEERITEVEKALRVYNETAAKAAGQRLEGLVLFRDATTQEQKIVAVLQAMIQLNSIGQNLASLELGEKMFGSQFVDRIRQGKTSAESMLKTINDASESSKDFFSDEMVRRAKEVDDQLKLAHQRLERELRPTWESLARTMLVIKSVWADVVDLIARAAALTGALRLDQIAAFLANPIAGAAGIVANRLLGGGVPAPAVVVPQLTVTPSRGTGAAPTPRSAATATGRDRFDAAIDSIEKRTAALDAETLAIDLGTAARERARVVAELETVAKQINTAAGINNGEVTAEQRVRIDAVADAFGRAKLRIENATSPLATFDREAANVGKQLNQFAAGSLDTVTNELANVVTGTKTAADAFKAMATSIINDLARIAIRQAITGPIASALFGTGLFNLGGGPSPSPLIFAPGNAAGTDNWRGGLTWVGEKGPELLNLPQGSQIIPNDIAMSAGGAVTVSLSTSIDARGSTITEARLNQIIAENNQMVLGRVVPIVRSAQSRRVL